MALVWQYGEKSGYEAWKGLSWGMVSLFILILLKKIIIIILAQNKITNSVINVVEVVQIVCCCLKTYMLEKSHISYNF